MSNDINDLRSHLFDALRGLKDKSMDLETAKGIADIGQVIINSAKVEVDYMKATGEQVGSGFIPDSTTKSNTLAASKPSVVHRIKG